MIDIMATLAGIEPATFSLEVPRGPCDFKAHSDKLLRITPFERKRQFPIVGMSGLWAKLSRRRSDRSQLIARTGTFTPLGHEVINEGIVPSVITWRRWQLPTTTT